jgi:hypothetical protein
MAFSEYPNFKQRNHIQEEKEQVPVATFFLNQDLPESII